LLGSLGFQPTWKNIQKRCTNCKDDSYRSYVRLSFRLTEEIPNLVQRKKFTGFAYKKSGFSYGFSVEPVGKGEYFGFTVDSNHLYVDEHFFIQHNCGKSFLIADITRRYNKPVLILQPSQELLEQNLDKFYKLGGEASIYSASLGSREISKVTYATLKSVMKDIPKLKMMGIETVLIDEAHHSYSPEPQSEFMRFMTALAPKKVIGLTATPFRLKSTMVGSELKLLTRMRPNYFKHFISIIQVSEIVETGYWSDISYEIHEFDENGLEINTSGSDFTTDSVKKAIQSQGVNNNVYLRIKKLLKEGCPSILCFVDSVETAKRLCEFIPGAEYLDSQMKKKDRNRVVSDFKAGKIKVVFNHSILTTGFDYPDLRCVIMARPTMSLALYYQIIGRGTRISPETNKKSCLFIDYGNNCYRFGKIQDLVLEEIPGWGWGMFNKDIALTNTLMAGLRPSKQDIIDKVSGKKKAVSVDKIWFGKYTGTPINELPLFYVKFLLNETGWDFSSPKMKALKDKLEEVILLNSQRSFSFT
jgi:DNA repair protein RadD